MQVHTICVPQTGVSTAAARPRTPAGCRVGVQRGQTTARDMVPLANAEKKPSSGSARRRSRQDVMRDAEGVDGLRGTRPAMLGNAQPRRSQMLPRGTVQTAGVGAAHKGLPAVWMEHTDGAGACPQCRRDTQTGRGPVRSVDGTHGLGGGSHTWVRKGRWLRTAKGVLTTPFHFLTEGHTREHRHTDVSADGRAHAVIMVSYTFWMLELVCSEIKQRLYHRHVDRLRCTE